MSAVTVRGMAHITGGGIVENVPRCLPDGLAARIRRNAWEVPAVFTLLQQLGGVPEEEMYRAFNMGIGFVLVVPRAEADLAVKTLSALGENPVLIGEIVSGEGVRLD